MYSGMGGGMYQGFGNTTAPIVKAKIWATDSFVSEFCDHFAEDLNTPVEVSDSWQTFGRVLDHLLKVAGDNDTFPKEIVDKIKEPLTNLRESVEKSEMLYRKYQSYQQWKMQYYLSKMVDDITKLVNTMTKVGDIVVFPVQIPGIHEAGTAFIVEYVDGDTVRVTVINVSPFTEYHPKTVGDENPSKIKQQVALTVSAVPKAKICSEAWWSIVMLSAKSLQKENVFYTHFLPWLTGRNHEGQIADHISEAYYATPAKSTNAVFWKSLVHVLKYVLRRSGLAKDEVKFVRHYVKQYMLEAVEEDLGKVKSIKLSTKKLIESAAQNTAISVARNEKMFPMQRLDKARQRIEDLTAKLLATRCDDEGITPAPPTLDITNGWDKTQQPEAFPLAECLRRLEGVDQFAGAAIEHARAVPTNFLRIPEHINTFEDALLALNEGVLIVTRLVAQFGLNKNHPYLVNSMVTHLFLESLPLPLGPETRKKTKCIWSDTPMRYGQQLHALKRLHELSEYYMAAIFSIDPNAENDGVRITVVGCMAAIADALIRVRATDKPSLFSQHFSGFKGKPPFGTTAGKYAQQTELIQFMYPEALLARARILDYYHEIAAIVPDHQVLWKWEDGVGKQDKAAQALLRQIAHSEAFNAASVMHLMGSQTEGSYSVLCRYYTEMSHYRDITFFFKHLMGNNFVYKNDWLACWDASLRWEHVEGEGFNVYGFEGTQLKTEAKTRFPSYAIASRFTAPHEVLCEDDILHIKNLTTFDDVMGQRDTELLLSYLTVPYIRIPLVLRFFATEDRISCLKNNSIQNILNGCLFEGGKFLGLDLTNIVPQEVPSEKAELIACPYGTLLNELFCSTDGVIEPIIKLVSLASELDSGTVYNETTTNVILFLVRVVARVQNYIMFALDMQEGKVRHPDLIRDVQVNEVNREKILKAYHDVRNLIRSQLLPMLETWINEAMRNAVEAQKTDDIDKATALASKLHAHGIMLLRNVRPDDYDEVFLSSLLSSFTFLTTRYTWMSNVLPELELYFIIQRHRRHIIRYLSSQPPTVMSGVMDAVVRIVTSSGNRTGERTHDWGFVAGNDCVGRFARLDEELLAKQGREKGAAELMASLKQCLGLEKLPADAFTVFEGMQDVELNVHTLSLTFKNAHLRALPSEIAQDLNVYNVFVPLVGNKEKLLETMQCAIVEDSVNRQWVRLVGQDHDIQYWKTQDQRFPIPADNMTRFYPDDLAENEQWVYDLFEPVRLSYFERSFWDPPIFNLIQEHKLTNDNSVCVLSAVDSQSGKMLKEVYVFRDFKCVHLYDVFSYGRRFYRRLVYTTDNRYSLLQLHPSIDRRAKPWPNWGRHMAGDPDPDNSTESPTSCVILRHSNHPENISKSTETYIPGYLLYGLIPSALIESHRFWQDADDNIRGYPISEKDDESKPTHMIWIHWKEAKFDPLGIKNTTFQVYRFARSNETPRASEEAVIKSQQLKLQDGVDEELEMTRAASYDHANADLEAGAFRQSSVALNHTEAATIEDHNLLLVDLMYSREGTPLHSLAKCLSRIELLSHILVWTTKTDYDSSSGEPLTLDLIQLPRLKLSFAAKLAPDGTTYLLYSLDHAHLFVSNLRQPLVIDLLQGIPHSLILADTNNAVSILVPSLNIVRPFITTAPFSTELVINRSDMLWYKKLDTRYYLYPVHVSLSFMFTPTLASALYLLLLRFYNRNYQDVFRLTSNIGTDMEFTSEESQIFNKLTYVLDSNPNAHACRSKISLMVADSPIQLGWYTPAEVASMIAKFSHVNVSCRMTQSEERRLLYICHMLEAKMGIIRAFVKRPANQEATQLVLAKIADKSKTGQESNMQQRKMIREFYKNLTTELREKLDVRIIREDLNRLLFMYNQHARDPLHSYHECLLTNRRTIIEAEVEGKEDNKVTFKVPQFGEDLGWLWYTKFNALSAKPPGSAPKQKNDEGRIVTMSKSWDYFYCGAQVRKANQCRCRGCSENCGPTNGCPCLSCEKFNKADGANIRELIPALDAQKSARSLSFFEAFMWVNDSVSRYASAKLNEQHPYMEKQFPSSLREPMNSFLRYYELVTGTTKIKICSHESGKDFATLLFPFCRDARNESSGLGHMMHFVLANPQCWNKLVKYNRNSKQKMEQRTMNIYNSILTQAASYRDPHCDVDSFPKCNISPTMERTIVPRKDTRSVEVPLHLTTILPIPRNTDCNKKKLTIPEQKDLQLLGTESERLAISPELLKELCGKPLEPVLADGLVTTMTRKEQQLEPISDQLPFDLSKHEHASKTVARDMLSRITDDMKHFANKENDTAVPKLVGLATDAEVRKIVCGKSTPELIAVRDRLTNLHDALTKLRDADLEYLNYATPVITRTANHIEFTSDRSSALLFLRRFAGKEATLTIDFLISSLCSSTGDEEWQQLNPFLKKDSCTAVSNLITVAVLRANRVGHANRATEITKELLGLLNKADKFPDNLGEAQLNTFVDACITSILQKADTVAAQLLTSRVYINAETMEFDPRFLLFEFTWNLVLRDRQREQVLEMYDSIMGNKSLVKQMIMGAGKTTVVGPLLALMLADSKQLVIQVVPPALLDFTRAVLRTTFSSVLQKLIFTFVSDRSSEVDSEILSKFEHAKQSRGIVVTTPSSIKSIFLKYVEGLDRIVDEGRERVVEMEKEAKDLLNLVKIWRESVLIMDEVDMLLHPLKSELNFPIGAKHDIDFTPTRWKLPIHLIDAIFYFHTHRITTTMKESPDAHVILNKFKAAVRHGLSINALQEMPHLTLLNMDFYDHELKPILAEWALLFLKSQHLTGLSDADTIRYVLRRPTKQDEPEFVERVLALDEDHIKMLNLTFEWLSCFMPHIMQKIDRVSFGVMNNDDMKRAREEHPNMPRSRYVTAIPFIGKDLPSQSSEFAHPDVVIGLTILAYRYEGLRNMDFTTIMREVHAAVEKEVGRFSQRRTNVMYTKWVQSSGGRIITNYSYKDKRKTGSTDVVGMQPSESVMFDEDGNVMEEKVIDVLPLKLMKQANVSETDKLFKLFRRTAEVIHWYLCESIFPEFMRHQHLKLSASGQELGGNIMFERRIGFSGTPSDLLPIELGRCGYERGTDGQLIHTLTNPSVMSYRVAETGWSVRTLLDTIANASPPFHALIDTGALITGMSNLQVAQYLLKNGLPQMEGVVFLDEFDRKMILVRATGRVLKLAECGIPKVKRFAFYDQVHTTGMDIEHTPNAQAVQTLGKDMTFRDFSQGAYRMRGISQGQTVHLLIIPEVYDLINRTLKSIRKEQALPDIRDRSAASVLEDVTAWLLVNSIRSEHTQHNQLCLQSCANVWRKEAFHKLADAVDEFKIDKKPSEDAVKALEVFRETVSFDITDQVPQPRMFSEAVAQYVGNNTALINSEEGRSVVNSIMDQTKREDEVDNPVIDVQMVQEQEEEKETEQEQEKEQEIEVEKFVDLAYSRDEEQPGSWKLDTLKDPSRAVQFYKLSDFHLYKRRPLDFPDSIYLSRNFFNTKWSGHRRMKNVIVTMEWIPDTAALELRDKPSTDYGALEADKSQELLAHTLKLVGDHQKQLTPSLVKDLLMTALHYADPESAEWDSVISRILKQGDQADSGVFFNELAGNTLRNEQSGRYTVAVTLAEAETLRRVIHLRQHESSLISGANVALGLNAVPSNNARLDVSCGYVAPIHNYLTQRNFQCLRYFDCDLHYTDAEFGLLLRSLHSNPEKMRQAFFQQVIATRRRARQRWERTPIALLFMMRDAFSLLHQRAIGLCIRRHLEAQDLNLGDAFLAFNNSHSGILSADELWGATKWCGLELDVEEILDFIDVADTAHEGTIQYPDFLCVLTGHRELEEDAAAGGHAPTTDDAQGKKLPTVPPFGLEEVKLARGERIRKQRAAEAEANKELESENQRVMDEIENEQIAEDIRQVQESGNPFLDETSLTYTFQGEEIPKLVVPYGARVRRLPPDVDDGNKRAIAMQSNSGLRFHMRLLKRLRGSASASHYCLSFEFKMPRPTTGDTKKGTLSHVARMGKHLNLVHWALPMFRFSGYSANNVPPFEIEVFGVANPNVQNEENREMMRQMKKSGASPSEMREALKKSSGGTGTGGGPNASEAVHIFSEPRPCHDPDGAVGEIKPGEFVHTDGEKTSNAIDGVTYEWMHIISPVVGWCVKEKNGKTLWEQLGTSVTFTDKGFHIDHSSIGMVGLEHVGTFEETTEDDLAQQDKHKDDDDEDDNPVELTTDVGDLLEALRKAKRLKSGDKVQRNPECWEKGNEDGGAGNTGKVLKVEGEKVTVQWPGGNKGSYEWGNQGRFELIKVGEADSDDEGEERETMNDERWMAELRKGGQNCNHCSAQKLEPGNWFRCNHCENYHLCKKCFRGGAHNEHDFTDMGALNNMSAGGITPGAYVRIKLSVTNPKYGWEGCKAGDCGVVLDVDQDENCCTVEMKDGTEWRGDLNEIEQTKDPKEEQEEAEQKGAQYGFLTALDVAGGRLPFLTGLVEAAKTAVQGKFKAGDRVKARIDGHMYPAEIRAVLPEKEYALAVDNVGYRSNIAERVMEPCNFKIGDRVRYKRSLTNFTYGLGSIPQKDMHRVNGSIVNMKGGQHSRHFIIEVDWEEVECRTRCTDMELDVVGNGKWSMTKITDEGNITQPLPTSSNVMVERAFQDGIQQYTVFIRDDTYAVDFATNEVRKGQKVVGSLSRDPPDVFIKGEAKKQLDDGNPHLISMLVDGHSVQVICDGKPMSATFTGVLQGIKDKKQQQETIGSAMKLLASTPLMVLQSPISAEMAKAHIGAQGGGFPLRVVNWVRVDWGAQTAEEVQAWHQCVDDQTAWKCRECGTLNSRQLGACEKCKASRVQKKEKTDTNLSKFRSAMPRSREAAAVRNNIQGHLRALYQVELDRLDQAAADSQAQRPSGGGGGGGSSNNTGGAVGPNLPSM